MEKTRRAFADQKFAGITEAFKADNFKEKINLGVGAYRELFLSAGG